ncbi:Zf-FLZ domain containing protein [Trema orientale]|uniref:Zf-FLZ domain containing protein n=1 Tax=Trema orientale TaxID=63057 RepID=A0A2P5DYE4_TREOI|nr:Zf-FLZ domain containing protein [Trema orientale]
MNRSSILGKETKCGSHERSNSNPVGLRILVEISTQGESNYVVKSASRISTQPTRSSAQLDNCFLKTCNLCNKGLSLDKEVYMYRGDQGFCSIECRDRQIYLDEIKDLEASTKKMIASYRNSCINDNPSRHEPRRHKPISYNNHRRNNPLVIIS